MKLFEKLIESLGFLAIMAIVEFFIGIFKASKKANVVIKNETGFDVAEWLAEGLELENETKQQRNKTRK